MPWGQRLVHRSPPQPVPPTLQAPPTPNARGHATTLRYYLTAVRDAYKTLYLYVGVSISLGLQENSIDTKVLSDSVQLSYKKLVFISGRIVIYFYSYVSGFFQNYLYYQIWSRISGTAHVKPVFIYTGTDIFYRCEKKGQKTCS